MRKRKKQPLLPSIAREEKTKNISKKLRQKNLKKK